MASKTTTEPTTDNLTRAERIAAQDEFGRQLHNLFLKACRAVAIAKRSHGKKQLKINGKQIDVCWGAHSQDTGACTIYISILGQYGLAPRIRRSAVVDDHVYLSQKPTSFDLWMTRDLAIIEDFAQRGLKK